MFNFKCSIDFLVTAITIWACYELKRYANSCYVMYPHFSTPPSGASEYQAEKPYLVLSIILGEEVEDSYLL